MPILDKWNLQITTDQVLRAQGADPDEIRVRRPSLLTSTIEAIKLGNTIFNPIVLYQKYTVKQFIHDRVELMPVYPEQGRCILSGPLIVEHLGKANEVIVMLCTIGKDLEETISSLFNVDPVAAIALDGFGSAAVEILSIEACNYFENKAQIEGFRTSMPLNPGMIGWPLDIGQAQIFSLLDSEEIHISLTDSFMMIPNKSLSIILGVGLDFSSAVSSCKYCSLKGVCKYQNHYVKQA